MMNLVSERAARGQAAWRGRWALFVLLLACPLWAQGADADRDAARALGQQGQLALKRGDFATARDLFAQAERLYLAPTLTLGLARAQVGLGRLATAREIYRRLPQALPPDAPVAFQKAIEAARLELAALEPRVPRLVLRVEGATNAEVTLDGAPFPAAALGVEWPLDPGPHEARASAAGRSETARFDSLEGASLPVVLRLPAPEVIAPEVSSAPSAPVASSAPAASSAPVADAVRAPLASAPAGWRRPVGWAGLGLGVAGLATAGVFGLVAMSRRDALIDRCGGTECSEANRGQYDEFRSSIRGANVAGVVGVVGLLVGAPLLLLTPARPRQAAVCAPGLTLGLCGTF